MMGRLRGEEDGPVAASPTINSYEEALRYLIDLTRRGVQPGLERVTEALRLLDNPERSIPAVIVGGTNGKGSVSAIIARAAFEQGLLAGLFTSPHLHRLTERIRLNGQEVGRTLLIDALRRLIATVEVPDGPALTFFEALTVLAADLFSRYANELGVYEVGLGGRLDATRLMPARLVVLTNVALDHQRFLGATLESIGREKFALVREEAMVVAGPLPQRLQQMLIEKAEAEGAELWLAGRDFRWERRGDQTIELETPLGTMSKLHVPLRGAHQAANAAVAVAALQALAENGPAIAEEPIRRALSRVKWPGRLELILKGRVLLDVAHNPAGIEALCATLPQLTAGRAPVIAVVGCMSDKDVAGIVSPLAEVADHLLLAAPRMGRALPADQFPAEVGGQPMESVESAADEALRRAGDTGLVVIAGSTFIVSEARAHLLGLTRVDPSIPM